MDRKTIAAYDQLLEHVRSGQLDQESTLSLSQKLGVSKSSTARLLDLMEWQGLIEKRRGTGLIATGIPAFQGHLSFCFPADAVSQPLRTSKVSAEHLDPTGGKALAYDRLIQLGHGEPKQTAAYEHHLFHPALLIGPEQTTALSELYLDRLVYEQLKGQSWAMPKPKGKLPQRRTTGTLQLTPTPVMMKVMLGTEEPAVIMLEVKHWQGERLIWQMQRHYHPQWQGCLNF